MNTGNGELRRKWSQSTGIMNLTGHPSAAGAPSWYRVVNRTSDGPAELYIYDEIGWFGVSATDFTAELRGLNANAIDLHINSPGGSASDGVTIYNALASHPAQVTTIVDGWAASAASVVAMAGDRIEMREGSLMMIHKASGPCYGNDDDMEATAQILRKVSGSIADIYTARRGGDRDKWLAAMAAETWYTPAEAVTVGLADQAAGVDEAEPDNRTKVAAQAAPVIDPQELRRIMQEAFQ